MKLRDFLGMYSNQRGITKINDDNLGMLATGTAAQIIYGFCRLERSGYSYSRLWNKEVVSFEYHDDELCVRVR
ncbi:hypothetical protein [Holdemanella biformis]|uniref:hypothetical protein n=1 Tax=Holdemanella biformis TaxID=1735 RepID=UPI0024913F32|nr:hypothetical protein [Holdemanella biformis]